MAIQKITADVIATSAVTTDSLSDSSITAAKLHTTLDLTGKTVTVATASAGDNDTTVASTAFVSTAIANLADSAPSTLDTLNELAAALGDDANFSTTVTNSIATKLPLAGGTLTGNLNFGDSDKAVFGAGNDLEIFHNGTSSYIRDVGDGDLQIFATDDVYIRGYATNNYMARFNENGAVTLYHNNSVKLATTSTGIDVTGTVVSDGLTVDGTATFNIGTENIGIDITSTDAGAYIALNDNNATGFYLGTAAGIFYLLDTGNSPKLKINNNGDISFYDDTGVSQALFWDASAKRLGIGTTSPSDKVQILDSGNLALRVESSGASNQSSVWTENNSGAINGMFMYGSSHSTYGAIGAGEGAFYSNTNVNIMSDSASGVIKFSTGSSGGTERMRIDASGNVGIGTSSTPAKLTINGEKYVLTNSGRALGGIHLLPDSASGAGEYGGAISFSCGSNGSSAIAAVNEGGSDTDSNGLAFIVHSSGTGTADGVEAMRIDELGNVGIGVTSPNVALEVDGGTANGSIARFHNENSRYLEISAESDGTYDDAISVFKKNSSVGQFAFRNSTTEYMRIDSGGRVMIAETSNSGYSANADDLIVGNNGSATERGISIGATSGGSIRWNDGADAGVIEYAHSSDSMRLYTAGSEKMRIDSSGNVGIGTTSPVSPLQVNVGTNLNLGVNEDSSTLRLSVYDDAASSSQPMTINSSSTRFDISDTETMRIDSGGHVIIGSNLSTTEGGKLSVYTDATNDAAIYGYRSTSYFRIVPFLSNGAFSSLSNVNDSGLFFSDNFVIAKHATGNYGAIFHGNGSIFIGTESEATGSTGGASFSADSYDRRNLILATTSTGNLELVEFRNPNGTVGTIKSNGTSTSYNTSSDYRLKENIDYDFTALNRVAQLKPARFNFITDEDTILDGFLAHEVSSIVPEAVSGEKDATKEEEYEITPAQYEDDGETLISEAVMATRTVPVYQGIDQSKLVPLLTKAIQELSVKLEAAEARITELEG
jgi:hypothetical protein